jgi:hypothetical protein
MPLSLNNEYKRLLDDAGRAGAHALFPNDIEYYMCAFELVDSEGNSIDYFAFPVMPSEMTRDKQEFTNIKKTMGGITALSVDGFVPVNFQISGILGRKLRVLLSSRDVSFSAFRFSTKAGVFKPGQVSGNSPSPSQFNTQVKTGYGATKILESIIEKSNMLDNNNKPLRLYFYNPTFNESYLIKITNSNYSQDESRSNIMWSYRINFTAIAPLDQLLDKKNTILGIDLGLNVLAKGVNTIIDDIRISL